VTLDPDDPPQSADRHVAIVPVDRGIAQGRLLVEGLGEAVTATAVDR
jgi:hypothetical protein